MNIGTGDEILTGAAIRRMQGGQIFAAGESVNDDPSEPYREGDPIRWLAILGQAKDWAIYFGPVDWNMVQVRALGQKLTSKAKIRRLVPCDDKALERYRL